MVLETSYLAKSAVLAPSADNRHRFVLEPTFNGLRLLDHHNVISPREYHRTILTLISYGAVSENIRLEAQRRGYHAQAIWFPDKSRKDLVAEFLFSQLSEHFQAPDDLVEMIERRHTNRRFYYREKLSMKQIESINEAASSIEAVQLQWCDAPQRRNKLLSLIKLAETERFRSRYLHQELFSAVRFDVGWKATADEGLPPGSLEVEPGMKSMFAMLRHWGVMQPLTWLGAHHVLALRAAYLPCRFAPHLGIISAESRFGVEQGAVAVGHAFQRVWLKITSMGLALQPIVAAAILPFVDAVDGPSARVKATLLQGWAGICETQHTPLVLFRLGKARAPTVVSGRKSPDIYMNSSRF